MQFSLSKFLAKYWLETTIGVVAALVLLVGLIVSQTTRQPAPVPAFNDAGVASSTSGLALAVLPGRVTVTLDSIKLGDKMTAAHYHPNATVVLTDGQGIALSGWAIDPSTKTSPAAVFAQVDDFARAQASVIDRPDVAQAYKNPDYEKSGFVLTVPPQLLAPGKHRLSFVAEDAKRTGYLVIPAWFTVVVQPGNPGAANARRLPESAKYALDAIVVGNSVPIGATEFPAPAKLRPDEAVVLGGWAVDSLGHAPASAVAAVIDGKRTIGGSYGIARPDVAAAFGNPSLAPTGFSLTIPAGSLSRGVHNVDLKVFNRDGTAYYLVKDRVRLTVE